MSNARRLRRGAGYLILGLVLYLVFLLATAPAVWLAEATTRLSDGALTLASPRGTFWRGAGELYAGGPATGVRHLGTLQWQANPLWLFVGRAQLAMRLDGDSARGQASVRVGLQRNINVRELNATLPAQLTPLVYPPAAFFAPTGTIEIQAPSVDLSREGLVAVAEAQWRRAGGRFTGPEGLGDYRVEITSRGDLATFRLTTLRGNLELAGEGQWRVTGDGELRFNGSATPKGNASQLEPLLRALGRDLGGGRREIRFVGKFPVMQQLGY